MAAHGPAVGAGDDARRLQVEGDEAGGLGLRHIDAVLFRREADPVRRVERPDGFADRTAPGRRVEEAGHVSRAPALLAVVGEPEAARPVENEVVRPLERLAPAIAPDRFDRAGF